MSLKEAKKISANRYELEIVIDGETFSGAIRQAYEKNVGKINVKGFRKGKAPQHIIEKMYGEDVFYEDALNLLYSDAIDEAAEAAGVTIIDDQMKFDLVSIGKDGVDFKVELTTKPEVELNKYRGLAAEKLIVEVTDEEVNAEIDRMAKRNARVESIEGRPAKDGDIAVIDFEGFVDDKAFEGGKGEAFSLTLGSGQFIPGFEEQVVGHEIGEEFDINVVFPEDYGSDELKGKPAVFKIKLHELKENILPEIDDEFAKDVSEFDTLDALKEDIKAKSLERKANSADQDVENQLMEALVAEMKAEIPDAMIENRVKQSLGDFEYRMQMQGLKLETYLQYTGSTLEEFKNTLRPQAEQHVKVRLALEKVAELENIVPSDEEISEQYTKLAAQYGVDEAQVKAVIPASEVGKDLAVEKAIEIIKTTAEVKEVKEKSVAKKPAAKKTASKSTTTKKTTSSKSTAAKKPAAKKTEKVEEEK